jgi:hypothetical protein
MTRNLQSEILRRAAGIKNSAIASAIGHDDGHVSRIHSGERGLRIEELEGYLSALGLKVIACDGDVVSLPAEELKALRVLARKALD